MKGGDGGGRREVARWWSREGEPSSIRRFDALRVRVVVGQRRHFKASESETATYEALATTLGPRDQKGDKVVSPSRLVDLTYPPTSFGPALVDRGNGEGEPVLPVGFLRGSREREMLIEERAHLGGRHDAVKPVLSIRDLLQATWIR